MVDDDGPYSVILQMLDRLPGFFGVPPPRDEGNPMATSQSLEQIPCANPITGIGRVGQVRVHDDNVESIGPRSRFRECLLHRDKDS